MGEKKKEALRDSVQLADDLGEGGYEIAEALIAAYFAGRASVADKKEPVEEKNPA